MAISENTTITGLSNPLVIGLPSTDVYTVQGTLEIPSIIQGAAANSQVVVTVLHNSSTVYTGLAGAKGFSTGFSATAGDTMTITLTSSAAVDQGPNAVKCSIQMFEGAN